MGGEGRGGGEEGKEGKNKKARRDVLRGEEKKEWGKQERGRGKEGVLKDW